jgi:hypothetical protein
MFREIRGVEQRHKDQVRRWFQDDWFDLFVTLDPGGDIRWLQLCYARDSWRERVLEWKRGRGFQHMKLRSRTDAARDDSGALVLDGAMPYLEVTERFEAAAAGLPAEIAAFVAAKIREYARPARKWPSRRPTPRWLERLRERERIAARLRFLDSGEPSG